MTTLQFTEKFIAFLDVVGWKSHVRASEEKSGLSLSELSEILTDLGTDDDRKQFEQFGPIICPEAPYIKRNIDFCITCVSDSVLISTEISPAGPHQSHFPLLDGLFQIAIEGSHVPRLHQKRPDLPYLRTANRHRPLSDVVELEKQVSIFKNDVDEKGTPFIEVDAEVVQYVENQPDRCVKEMFSRMTKSEDDLTAIFPFQRLNHSFTIGGSGKAFDPDEERESLNIIRGWIHKMKEQVQRHIDLSDETALRKGDHYIRILDAQLAECAYTEQMIERLTEPYASYRTIVLMDVTTAYSSWNSS